MTARAKTKPPRTDKRSPVRRHRDALLRLCADGAGAAAETRND